MVPCSPAFSATTFDYMEVACSKSALHIILIYRPPSTAVVSDTGTSFIEEFESLLSTVTTKSGQIIVAGDFNIHFDHQRNIAAIQLKICLVQISSSI